MFFTDFQSSSRRNDHGFSPELYVSLIWLISKWNKTQIKLNQMPQTPNMRWSDHWYAAMLTEKKRENEE